MDAFEGLGAIGPFLRGRITLAAFLTDFKMVLVSRAVLEARDEIEEGKESGVEAREEAREAYDVAREECGVA
jgi:hypothetical protein